MTQVSRAIRGGNVYKDDGTVINEADLLEAIANAVLEQNSMEQRGLAANRPAANAVPVGTTYWSIDTGQVDVSDGTNWALIGEV